MSGGDVIQGTVASVDATPLGSELAAIANVGDTLLTVADVADFWAGTRLNLNGVIYPYTTVDDTAQTVLLTTPVTVAGVVADSVQVWDTGSNLVAVTTEATVIAQGDSSTGDPIMAVVAPGVIPYLPVGTRDPANAGDAENVTLEEINGVWHVTALAGSSMTQTLTAATIQTAADGLRMYMKGQASGANAADLINLWYSLGLDSEVTPASVGLAWNADTTNTSSPLSTSGPITSIPVNALSGFSIPAGSQIRVGTRPASVHSQTFTVAAPGAAVGATSIPVVSQTPNFAYPSGSQVTVVGSAPDGTTAVGGILVQPPIFSDTPAYPLPVSLTIAQYTASQGTGNYVEIITDSFAVGGTGVGASGTANFLVADNSGVRIGPESQGAARPILGVDFGNVSSVTTTGSGGVVQAHNLGVVPANVQVTPFMATGGITARVTAVTSSDFTIGFSDSTGAPYAGSVVGYFWEVKA